MFLIKKLVLSWVGAWATVEILELVLFEKLLPHRMWWVFYPTCHHHFIRVTTRSIYLHLFLNCSLVYIHSIWLELKSSSQGTCELALKIDKENVHKKTWTSVFWTESCWGVDNADHEKNSPYTNDTWIMISGIEYHDLSMNGILWQWIARYVLTCKVWPHSSFRSNKRVDKLVPASSEIVSFTNILQSFQRDKYLGSLPLYSETRNWLNTEHIIIDLHKLVGMSLRLLYLHFIILCLE